jgi:hypothetical protein
MAPQPTISQLVDLVMEGRVRNPFIQAGIERVGGDRLWIVTRAYLWGCQAKILQANPHLAPDDISKR